MTQLPTERETDAMDVAREIVVQLGRVHRLLADPSEIEVLGIGKVHFGLDADDRRFIVTIEDVS